MTPLCFVLLAALACAAANPIELNREKRQLLGGVSEADVNDPAYKKLAQESFDKYLASNPGGPINVKELKVTKVTTQVVAGTKTVLDFTVTPANGEVITCHSDVWEQAWLNKKEITVNCDAKDSRAKRQVPGGVSEADANDPAYKKLAQESFDKYLATNPGGPIDVKELKVTKVTTQVVAGTKTVLYFTVTPANGEVITCHSDVWEQAWLNKKEISVNCDAKQ
ncbi:sarcocystatin-A-like [Leguminivora glycinivorella]|uniref:sarcocystatin-A-like n=1 Tax=Leguminivora glycinivorella TaxID=1035111 RepID=UPI00200E5045|nr:sarcocystatin-A-like [Leguminivora glycinivorella]